MRDRHKGTMERRQLLRAGMIGLIATVTSALKSGTGAADTETNDDKRKARYQANSTEVQDFYRVNRYPKH